MTSYNPTESAGSEVLATLVPTAIRAVAMNRHCDTFSEGHHFWETVGYGSFSRDRDAHIGHVSSRGFKRGLRNGVGFETSFWMILSFFERWATQISSDP